MKILRKFSVILLSGIIFLAGTNVENVSAAQKSKGYHTLDMEIDSPDVSAGSSKKGRAFEASYNAADRGLVTSVKNQGNTELCWAFGLTSIGETSMIRKGLSASSVDFSEKHLGYFMYNRTNDALNNTSGDRTRVPGDWRMAGGNSMFSILSLTGWYGLANESTAPFNRGSWKLSSSLGQRNSAILKNGYFLGDQPQRDLIKSYIKSFGSVMAAYHAPTEDWENQKYYSSDRKAYNCNDYNQDANHIVTIVGWDNNYSRDNFNSASRPKNNGAWIVKNSWGTSEGNGGYFYLSYEDRTLCEYVAAEFVKSTDYQYNYFYDGSASPGVAGFQKGQGFANVYTAKKGSGTRRELLKAVNMVTWSPNVKYRVRIYKNPENGKPASGKKMLSQTGTLSTAGTHTINLQKKIEMLKGERFAIVVDILSSAKIGYDGSSDFYWISFTNKTKKGQSYIYQRKKWYDLNSDKITMRLKGYTVTEPTSKIHLRYCKTSSVIRSYSGKTIKPQISLYYGGKKLKKNVDYKVSVKKRKSIGASYVVFTGKGKYRGTRKVYYYIVPKKVSGVSVKNNYSKSVRVSFQKTKGSDGYQISYRKKGSKKTKKVTTTKDSKSIKKLSSGKKYYFKVRAYKKIRGKRYYGSYSKTKSIKVR